MASRFGVWASIWGLNTINGIDFWTARTFNAVDSAENWDHIVWILFILLYSGELVGLSLIRLDIEPVSQFSTLVYSVKSMHFEI